MPIVYTYINTSNLYLKLVDFVYPETPREVRVSEASVLQRELEQVLPLDVRPVERCFAARHQHLKTKEDMIDRHKKQRKKRVEYGRSW